MAIPSTGDYGIAEGVCYSYPVTIHNGEYKIVQGLEVSPFSRKALDATNEELLSEKADAFGFLEQ